MIKPRYGLRINGIEEKLVELQRKIDQLGGKCADDADAFQEGDGACGDGSDDNDSDGTYCDSQGNRYKWSEEHGELPELDFYKQWYQDHFDVVQGNTYSFNPEEDNVGKYFQRHTKFPDAMEWIELGLNPYEGFCESAKFAKISCGSDERILKRVNEECAALQHFQENMIERIPNDDGDHKWPFFEQWRDYHMHAKWLDLGSMPKTPWWQSEHLQANHNDCKADDHGSDDAEYNEAGY